MNQGEYQVKYYKDEKGHIPVREFLNAPPRKEVAKVFKYIEYLRINRVVLDEPYTRHIKGKV